ncbi:MULTISPECIES: FecCD family ABC transporter permease [unclassified Helicobacter]|uniref:FecCD family ABC transporter permease n=1 Tax=unclassified Helicobacter TaxID=2593540 RepID=UPI001F3DC1F2|nr:MULTISPECIES: iron ABC transporter permease [unclassified Helicobacter]
MQKLLWLCLVLCVFLALLFNGSNFSYLDGIQNVFLHLFYQQELDSNGMVLYEIRLPRIFLALLVGSSLAGCGAIMQNIFRNPLVDPFLLGISSGAALGCALCIGFFNGYGVGFFAFVGAMLAAFLILIFSGLLKQSQISLVLVGIIFSSFLGAVSGLIKYFVSPEKAQAIVIWLLGSLSLATWKDVFLLLGVVIICFTPLFLLRFRINMLALSDLECLSLGINPKTLKIICILLISCICGVAVSVSGTIGWIGLIVPHFARIFVGSNMKVLLPSSMLLGAIILLFMDFLAKNITTSDLPVGALSAIVGAPLFLFFLLLRKH